MEDAGASENVDDNVISFKLMELEEINNEKDDPFEDSICTEQELNEMYDRYVQNNLLQAEIPEAAQTPEEAPQVKKGAQKKAVLLHQKADKIASKSVKDKTHIQTKWEVKVFQGISYKFYDFCTL